MNYRLVAYNCLSQLSKKAVVELRNKVIMIECMKNDTLDFNDGEDAGAYWNAMERTIEDSLDCTIEERNAIISYFLE